VTAGSHAMPVRTFVRRTLPLTGDNGRLLKNVLSSASGAVDKVAYYIPPRDATAFLRKASSRCLGCVGRIARGWARKANCEPERNRGIVIDMSEFNRAVAGLRADLAEPLTKGAMSSDQALLGFKAAIDAALGRGSQALTEWIAGFK
jgi:hypothetical protein